MSSIYVYAFFQTKQTFHGRCNFSFTPDSYSARTHSPKCKRTVSLENMYTENGWPLILIDTYILSPLALIHLLEIRRQTLQKVYLETKTEG